MPESRRARTRDHAAFLKRLGAHVRRTRRACGYSTDRLSLEAGFSRANMSRIERGLVDPTAGTMRKIAVVLGVPLRRLFDFQ